MTKHTPGPGNWETDGGLPYICGDGGLVRVAEVCPQGWGGTVKSAMPNAHLIAAAPDLYDALSRLRGFALNYASPSALDAGRSLLDAVDAAISKAEGRRS